MHLLLSFLPMIVAIVVAFSAMSKADSLAKRVARLEAARDEPKPATAAPVEPAT